MQPVDPNQPHHHEPYRTHRIFTDSEYWERTINDYPCTHCGASERNPLIHIAEAA